MATNFFHGMETRGQHGRRRGGGGRHESGAHAQQQKQEKRRQQENNFADEDDRLSNPSNDERDTVAPPPRDGGDGTATNNNNGSGGSGAQIRTGDQNAPPVGGSNTLCVTSNNNEPGFSTINNQLSERSKIAGGGLWKKRGFDENDERATFDLSKVMTDMDIIENGYRNSPYVIVDGDGVLFSGAPKPRNEKERLLAIRASGVLDIENRDLEEHLDLLTSICATALRVPMCLVSIVGNNKQHFKSNIGLDATGTKREQSFCGWTLLPEEPKVLLVEDARKDFRFQTNDLVLGPPHLRFYAGAPIVVRGVRFGSFCVLDTKPRHDMSGEDLSLLTRLADACAKTIERTAMQMYFMDAVDDSQKGFMLVSLGSANNQDEEEDTSMDDREDTDDDDNEEEERIPEEEYEYNQDNEEGVENMDGVEGERDYATMSILYANEATNRLLGFSKDKNIIGESLFKIFSEACASGQIKPNLGGKSMDEFFGELLNDENGVESNEKTEKKKKRKFAREISISKEFSVFDTKTTTSTNEEEEEEKDDKDGNTTKEEKDCAKQDKKKTQATTTTTTTTTTEKAPCRHIRVELSLKKSTFRRLQTCRASTAPLAPPTPQGARGTTLCDDEKGESASQKKTEFYVLVVNIMDITYEFNERLRLIESIRDKREESTKCGEEGKSLKKRSVC